LGHTRGQGFVNADVTYNVSILSYISLYFLRIMEDLSTVQSLPFGIPSHHDMVFDYWHQKASKVPLEMLYLINW
jgi:hypothetical protein